MKFVLVLTVGFAALALAAPPQLSDERKEKIAAVHKKCQEEVPIEESIFEKLKNHEKVDMPENWGAHQLCMSKGSGLMTDDGKINKDKVKEALEHLQVPANDLEEVVAKCTEEKETPEKTAMHLVKCFMKVGEHAGHDHDHSHHHKHSE